MNILNSRLKQLRKERGLHSSELAYMLGISISTYRGYEADKSKKYYREPSLDKIQKLANFYDVSMDYITGHSEIKQNHDKRYVMKLVTESSRLKNHHKEMVGEFLNLAIV